LIVLLSWEPHGGLLELGMAETLFTASPLDWSPPILGKLSVAAGRTYRVTVTNGAPWDYDELNLPYLLTTSME
jgi:hypothetical protein